MKNHKLLQRVANRLNATIRYLETPRLLSHIGHDITTDVFQKLDQPWFHALKIGTVLDIGANVGQFASTMHAVIPEAVIYSFEPVPACFEQLLHRMQRAPQFKGFNLALGDMAGELTFESNQFAPSSSLLKMAEAHKKEFPYTAESHTIRVKVERLDDFVINLATPGGLMIKIDVQGYEDRVLIGGEQTIKSAEMVLIETSFEMLYEGETLFPEVYRRMIEWGFRYVGSLGQLNSPIDCIPLQSDSLFLK
ncbi:MAG: FkbM family methyltransferase [Acidobacteria bacterium]|nr:FkbM family methyltransferase [Acidobacteriota bacterium]